MLGELCMKGPASGRNHLQPLTGRERGVALFQWEVQWSQKLDRRIFPKVPLKYQCHMTSSVHVLMIFSESLFLYPMSPYQIFWLTEPLAHIHISWMLHWILIFLYGNHQLQENNALCKSLAPQTSLHQIILALCSFFVATCCTHIIVGISAFVIGLSALGSFTSFSYFHLPGSVPAFCFLRGEVIPNDTPTRLGNMLCWGLHLR